MAERTLAEAVADLRLSDRRLAADFATIRARLLASVRQLEADAAISVHFKIDEDDILDAFIQLESFSDEFAPTTKVRLDTDDALADLAALSTLAQPIVVGVSTDNVAAELTHLSATVPPITPPVSVDTEKAAAELTHLSATAPPITPPVSVDTEKAAAELTHLAAAVPPIVPQVVFDPAAQQRIQDRLNALKASIGLGADPAVAVEIGTRTQQRLSALRASIGLSADPTPAREAIHDVSQSLVGLPRDFEEAGDQAGKRFGNALIGGFKGIIGAVGIAAGGFLATSLVAGFNRLTTIRDATASLTVALGDATEAATLLDNVLGVVRGTPFNLDQFALAASNMVSFGIEAQKVPGYLTAIGEAAATRGSRANEFAQRLSTIFGQITTANRIGGEELLQFSEAGVNALVILANHFEVTTTEMRDMISSGVVPAREALDVLAEGILNGSTGVAGATNAFAGTMAKLRETLTGSIGGFKAATARFGVELIQPFESILISGFRGATEVIDDFAARVRKSFASLSTSGFGKGLIQAFEDLPETIDRVIDSLDKLGPALAPLAAIVGASGLGQLKTILGPLGSLIPGALTNPILAALAAFALFTPEIRDALLPAVVELGQAFAPLIATLGISLGKIVDSSVPAIESLIEAFTELMPLFESMLDVGVALASAFVPLFTAFGKVLSAIPIPVIEALILLFAAFKAINAVETSRKFQAFQGGLEGRFAKRQGLIDVDAAVKAQRTMSGLEASVAGAFSGMALASENGAARVTGAIGAISSVALGAVTAGPWGAAAAAVSVGVGLIIGHFTNASEKSAELKRHTDALATSFGENTLAIIKDKDALAEWADTAGDVSGVQSALGAAVLGDKDFGSLIKNGLDQLDLIAAGPVGESNAEKVLKGIKDNIDDLSGSPEILHALTDAFGTFGDDLGRIIPDFSSVGKLQEAIDAVQEAVDNGFDTSRFDADLVAFVESLNGADLTDAQTELLRGIFDLQKAAKGTDLQGLASQQLEYAAAQDASFAIALKYAEAQTGLNRATADYNDLLKLTSEALAFQAKNQNFLIDEQIRAALVAKGVTDEAINNMFRLAQELGVNVEDMGAGISDVLGKTMVEDFHKARDAAKTVVDEAGNIVPQLDDAAKAAKNLEAAVLLSAAAATRVGVEIDKLKGKLSFRTGVQDFVGDLRKISTGFGKIINESDLKKGEGLNKSLSDTRERIQQLQVDVAREADEAAAKAVDLGDRIERARAAGAVGGVALLENELKHVNDDAIKKQEELDKALTDARGKAGELSKLGAAPITFLQQLKSQAQDLHLSLFELFLSTPTDESQEAFQSIIAPALEDATNQFIDEATKHPENVKNLGIFYRQVLVDSLIQGGLDAETANKIAAEFFNPTKAGEAIAENAKLAQKKYVAEMRKAFEADPDLLKTLLSKLNAPGLPPEARDSIKQSIEDIFQQNQIELGIEPTLNLTDTDFATLLGFTTVPVELAPDISMKATQVNLEARELVVNVTGPSDEDVDDVVGLTQDQLDERANELQAQMNMLPPDSAAADKVLKDLQETIDAGAEITVTLQPAWEQRTLDESFKKFLAGHGLTAPIPIVLAPPPKPTPRPPTAIHEGGVFSEQHIAQIVSAGSYRIFAEPETHGEAYIPLSPFKRERSMQIMGQIADIFGVDLIPKMDKMPLPTAMTGAGSKVSPLDADMIGRAVARHTKPTAADRANAFAEQYEQGVHFERGAIVIEGAKTPRRTASELVSRLAELAVRRR